MGTVSFNGVLLFAHVLLLFFTYAFSWYRFIAVALGFVVARVLSITCDRWICCLEWQILANNIFFVFLLFSEYFLLFFELRVISQHSHNVATMIYAHKSEWHSFCLLTIVAIVPTMLIVLISGWWPCFHTRKTSIACLPSFLFCATINS